MEMTLVRNLLYIFKIITSWYMTFVGENGIRYLPRYLEIRYFTPVFDQRYYIFFCHLNKRKEREQKLKTTYF